MKLIKLVVELGDHLLNVCAFLLRVESLYHCKLHVVLRETTLLQEGEVGLLDEHVLHLGVLIVGQQLHIRLVDL